VRRMHRIAKQHRFIITNVVQQILVTLATCCGFPARASLMERERSVEDVESPRRCGGSVTLSPEVHHFFILRTAVIMAPRRAITTRVPWWPMLAEVAQIDHRIGQ
jgi:hypothetical protein